MVAFQTKIHYEQGLNSVNRILIHAQMRLNLPNYHCVQFELFSHFSIPLDKEADVQLLMNQTRTRDSDQEDNTRAALFVSKTSTRGVPHRVQGRLTMTRNPSDLDLLLSVSSSRLTADVGIPPRVYRPVSLLVNASTELFGPIEVTCHALFEYDRREGYRSKIVLPVPLIIPGEDSGVTHIESAQFSRRENDQIDYQIIVMESEDSESLTHAVSFTSTLELNTRSVRGLVNKARLISTRMLA